MRGQHHRRVALAAGYPANTGRAYSGAVREVVAVWNALVAEPLALLMAVVALICVIAALSFGPSRRDRILLAVLAILTGFSAWVMATGFRFRS